MIAWWDSLDTLVKLLYCVAVPSTLILIVQTVMAMLGGMDSGAGVDVSDTSGLSDFSGHSMAGGFHTDLSGGVDLNGAAGYDGAPGMGELADASDMSDMNGGQSFTDGGNPSDLSALRLFTLQSIVAFTTVFGWSSIAAITSGGAPALSVPMGIVFGLIAMVAIAKLVQISSRLTENGTVDMRNAIGETGTVYLPIPAKSMGEGKLTMYLQGRYMECNAVTDGENTLPTGAAVRIVDFRNGVLVVEKDS